MEKLGVLKTRFQKTSDATSLGGLTTRILLLGVCIWVAYGEDHVLMTKHKKHSLLKE